MLDHLELLFGSVGAVATAERLLLGVRKVVMPETCRPPEGLVTQAARIWPIVTVLMLVGLQYETSLEGFAAFLADIRTHVTVLRVPMGTESIRPVSTVVTLITGIWLVSCRGQIHDLFSQHYKNHNTCKLHLQKQTHCVLLKPNLIKYQSVTMHG